MSKSFNVNNRAGVILTAYGADVINKNNEEFNCQKRYSEGDVYETTLWEIMQIFGKCLYHGNPNVPFKQNSIDIKDEEYG